MSPQKRVEELATIWKCVSRKRVLALYAPRIRRPSLAQRGDKWVVATAVGGPEIRCKTGNGSALSS